MSKFQFKPLTQQEEQWLRSQLDAARCFVSKHSPDDSWSPIRLEALDRAYSIWFAQNETNGNKVNEAINAVGVGFGSILVSSVGFTWTIASDEQGTDLAVRALPNRGDVLIFPVNFVAKRWESRTTFFFEDSFNNIRIEVDRFAKEWETCSGCTGPAAC